MPIDAGPRPEERSEPLPSPLPPSPSSPPAASSPAPPTPAPSPPSLGADWVGLLTDELPVTEARRWAVVPHCGAVVTFEGTVRDHSDGRPGVVSLDYEAYEEVVTPLLRAVAEEARHRWPDIGRIVILHRIGSLGVTDTAVVVVVSTPGRSSAFAAASFCIDTVKATVPIWKKETWQGGQDWGTGSQDIVAVGELNPSVDRIPAPTSAGE